MSKKRGYEQFARAAGLQEDQEDVQIPRKRLKLSSQAVNDTDDQLISALNSINLNPRKLNQNQVQPNPFMNQQPYERMITTPGPKQPVSKLHKWHESDRKVKTPMPGEMQFGTFKARKVPKSLYERPSKKKQAQHLKSASKSVSSDEDGEDYNWIDEQNFGNKENFSMLA